MIKIYKCHCGDLFGKGRQGEKCTRCHRLVEDYTESYPEQDSALRNFMNEVFSAAIALCLVIAVVFLARRYLF